jgi:hypothetical protein
VGWRTKRRNRDQDDLQHDTGTYDQKKEEAGFLQKRHRGLVDALLSDGWPTLALCGSEDLEFGIFHASLRKTSVFRQVSITARANMMIL